MQLTSRLAGPVATSLDHVMNDLMPPTRLNARQLNALAGNLRRQAGSDDRTADSVAAALESVSRRRAAREPIQLLGLMAARVRTASYRLVWALRMQGEVGLKWGADSKASALLRKAAAPARASRTASLDPSAVRQALMAVEGGSGLSPELCEAMVIRGWAEWVDHVHGTPIDMNHPRSLLRLTSEGREQYQAVFAAAVTA